MRYNYLSLSFPAVIFVGVALGQLAPPRRDRAEPNRDATQTNLMDALPREEWQRIDQAIAKALAWLAAQQQPHGSFPTREIGEPAVTSLCVMAFLSAGHQPGDGPYGETLNRAIDFVLTCQKESGVFSFLDPIVVNGNYARTRNASYNHAIAGLMLCEAYGQTSRERSARIKEAVDRALATTARMQHDPPKIDPRDIGGWRYMHIWTTSRSDLSITAWQLMFLRSAKNAQFEMPDDEKMVTAGLKYVESLYQPQGVFFYGHSELENSNDRYASRGMMGAGILSLSLAGKHQTEMAQRAGDWLLENPFDEYGKTNHGYDRFHYSAYYCSNAAAQLGGKYWQELFPTLAKTLLGAQTPEGHWPPETSGDAVYGVCYPTALTVLALTPGYQLLPIYQR
jgi:hypothetical protein